MTTGETKKKIIIMSDSASDIPKEESEAWGIKIVPFTITVDDVSFKETEKTRKEFYEIMDNSNDIPKTAQITPYEFEEVYMELYEQGYTDVIYTAISSTGSNTYNGATLAKKNFFNEHPDFADKFRIHIIDSLGYTLIYGYAVVEAAKLVQKGNDDVEGIIAFIEDWCNAAAAYFVPMTLKYARKSGRISAAAAFAGELLGLKPIIEMADGVSKTLEKIRGEKKVIPTLLNLVTEIMVPQTPYIIFCGKNDALSAEFEKECIKKFGYKPSMIAHVGPAVASNAGNDLVGLVCRRKSKDI